MEESISKKENVTSEKNPSGVQGVKSSETTNVNSSKNSNSNKIKDFFITTLNGMAYGLFATLIVGTIINTIGGFFSHGEDANAFCVFMYNILTKGALALEFITGAGIGAGVAIARKESPLKTIVLAGVGEIAAILSLSTKMVTSPDTFIFPEALPAIKFQVGDPLTIYLVVISVSLLMDLVMRKKTPVDILIIPLFGSTVKCGILPKLKSIGNSSFLLVIVILITFFSLILHSQKFKDVLSKVISGNIAFTSIYTLIVLQKSSSTSFAANLFTNASSNLTAAKL
jgi:uncharacterized membrane protein